MKPVTLFTPLIISTVFAVSLPPAAADWIQLAQTASKPSFSTTMRFQRQTFEIVVRFHNPTSSAIKLGYGDCNFSYVMRVGGKQYTYPTVESFVFQEVCTARLNAPTIPARSSRLLFVVPAPEQATRALKAAESKFSGEFHFKYAILGQPLTVHIFKTP
jgi:hypothetical protein